MDETGKKASIFSILINYLCSNFWALISAAILEGVQTKYYSHLKSRLCALYSFQKHLHRTSVNAMSGCMSPSTELLLFFFSEAFNEMRLLKRPVQICGVLVLVFLILKHNQQWKVSCCEVYIIMFTTWRMYTMSSTPSNF